jgi:hypothetical protein
MAQDSVEKGSPRSPKPVAAFNYKLLLQRRPLFPKVLPTSDCRDTEM